jgi:hypothetical protein
VVVLWLAVAAFYAAVLLVGLGVLAAVTGASVLLALQRDRTPVRRPSQLLPSALLALAGAAAVGAALAWFGQVGGDVLAAAFAAS